jgi:hypothetical protein
MPKKNLLKLRKPDKFQTGYSWKPHLLKDFQHRSRSETNFEQLLRLIKKIELLCEAEHQPNDYQLF